MSDSGEGIRYRVLGPISMTPHTPTAAKVRVLLATLLVRANEAVSTTSLIDELWDIHPPRTAATTLQVYVSQLRRALGEIPSEPSATERRLHTVPPGYRLSVSADELDLSRFESLRRSGKEAYDQGEFATAAADLRESLALWTGVALSGVPHGPVLATTSVRLEELRTVTLEQRIAADLRLGHHHELTGELMELVNQHPYRETLHAHLMVALYRSDRQSDALQAFSRARKALVDELGVEPGAGLKRLHDRILRSDPLLAWQDPSPPRPVPRPPALWLPPATADFTGREAALAGAAKLIDDTEGQRGRQVLVIGGRAGVGKTTFAVEFARRNAASFPDGQVLIQLRGSQDTALDAAQTILTLLRRVGPAGAEPPVGTDTGELANLLHRAVEGRKLLLVLDDASSEEQLRPVLAAMPDIFTVITSRRPLTGLDGARHLVLDVLRASEAHRLLVSIAARTGRAPTGRPGWRTRAWGSPASRPVTWTSGPACWSATARWAPPSGAPSGCWRWRPYPTSRSGPPPRCSTCRRPRRSRWWSGWAPAAPEARAGAARCRPAGGGGGRERPARLRLPPLRPVRRHPAHAGLRRAGGGRGRYGVPAGEGGR